MSLRKQVISIALQHRHTVVGCAAPPIPPTLPLPSEKDPLSAISQQDLLCSFQPYLSTAGVLQFQVLLHEYLVDFIQDDTHTVTTHQSQVPVAL